MLTVWFAKYSELYRQINTYFSFRATWAPGPGILYYSMQSMHGAEKYYSVHICAAGLCAYIVILVCVHAYIFIWPKNWLFEVLLLENLPMV